MCMGTPQGNAYLPRHSRTLRDPPWVGQIQPGWVQPFSMAPGGFFGATDWFCTRSVLPPPAACWEAASFLLTGPSPSPRRPWRAPGPGARAGVQRPAAPAPVPAAAAGRGSQGLSWRAVGGCGGRCRKHIFFIFSVLGIFFVFFFCVSPSLLCRHLHSPSGGRPKQPTKRGGGRMSRRLERPLHATESTALTYFQRVYVHHSDGPTSL